MTILFLSRLFYPHVGGVEKHVLEISKILIKKGYKVIVITENYDNLSKKEEFQGINIIRINAGDKNNPSKFKIWFELLKHFKTIQSSKIVHCHDIFFWYLPFRFIFPFKDVYTTFHGYEGNGLPTRKAILMHRIAEKLSSGSICIGSFYKKWYGTNSTQISYGAVNSELIKQGAEYVSPKKDIMFLGRLEKETGIMDYLEAVSFLKKKGINLNMDIFGNGSLGNKAKEFALDKKLNVVFKGFVENASEHIKNYEYIFVSRYLGILEAMALKKPVFTVYNNAIKKNYLEMTPFADFISISKNAEEISLSLEDYINGKADINTKKAFEWVKNKTWENMVNLYLKLWKLK